MFSTTLGLIKEIICSQNISNRPEPVTEAAYQIAMVNSFLVAFLLDIGANMVTVSGLHLISSK